jgi:hypothetical protein
MVTRRLKYYLICECKIMHRIGVQVPKFTAMISEESMYPFVNAVVISVFFEQSKYS